MSISRARKDYEKLATGRLQKSDRPAMGIAAFLASQKQGRYHSICSFLTASLLKKIS